MLAPLSYPVSLERSSERGGKGENEMKEKAENKVQSGQLCFPVHIRNVLKPHVC